ncbi:MAG: potassium transporter, partial [Cyanothece sp. SIO2G6]|nr:potassium transporter [Cyanothece sp. SIO2G6]
VDADVLPQMPLVTGRIRDVLASTNIATAKSVVAVSDDEIQNLELGLLAHRVNPHCRLIIRTYDQSFTDKVAQIFPYAQVLCASALSAEAFAGAAFGENVVSLFRLYHQTVLVTQYEIEAGDTLNGLLLADIAYGYGVVPIWHQRDAQPPRIMPSDDVDLRVGDRLVVLATIRGLRRIEQGDLAPKSWQVALDQLFSAAAELEAASQLSRVSGCNINQAHTVLKQLPTVFAQRLYRHQALRLVRLLSKSQVKARLLPLADDLTLRK